jgi:hypothetical protein
MPRLPAITGKADVAAEHHPVVDAVIKVFGTPRTVSEARSGP